MSFDDRMNRELEALDATIHRLAANPFCMPGPAGEPAASPSRLQPHPAGPLPPVSDGDGESAFVDLVMRIQEDAMSRWFKDEVECSRILADISQSRPGVDPAGILARASQPLPPLADGAAVLGIVVCSCMAGVLGLVAGILIGRAW